MSTDFPTREHPVLSVETQVSKFDLLNAMLVSMIMIIGFLVLAMFLIWLTTAFDFSKQKTAVVLEVSEDTGDEKPEGEADDILEPGVEEFPEVDVPQLANALEAVTDAVSSVRGSLEERSGMASEMGKGGGFGSREGGPGGGGGGVPEYKRWIINYESDSIDTYAKQLSFFDIDIGVVHNSSDRIVRIRDPGGSPSVIQSNRTNELKTLRFMHKKPQMQRWDQTLATRQGVPLDDCLTCQFYPEATRQIIRQVEAQALEGTGKKLIEVRNTILKVIPTGSGFEFKVLDILYR